MEHGKEEVLFMKQLPEEKPIRIIDRTLPEIFNNTNMSRLDILDFCWTLKDIGVDILEINRCIMEKIGRLPEGLEFMLRVERTEDLRQCLEHKITRCIFDSSFLTNDGIAEYIRGNCLNATLEISACSSMDFEKIKQQCGTINGIDAGADVIRCLRILGLEREICNDWVSAAAELKENLGIELDICPCNEYSVAMAVALEAVNGKMEYITAAFSGYGGTSCYAPVEELIFSMKLYGMGKTRANLTSLPSIKKMYEKFTHRKIPSGKPVIGEGIFKYESGIHAGAIEKEPGTYEPYEPSLVGQKRELVVGKHSGRRSVKKKLSDLGFRTEDADLQKMLSVVRDTSIRLGRSLDNSELTELYYGHR